MNLPDHLGGHMNKVHTDRGCLIHMRDKYNCKTMIDIGCGPGWQSLLAYELGYKDVYGIDGDWNVLPKSDKHVKFLCHDFTKGLVPLINSDHYYEVSGEIINHDLGWTVEFLEHVEEQYQENYMKTLQTCKYVIMTHAVPGQDGHHHVNCQESDYWIDVFNQYEFDYLPELTNEIREVSTMQKPFIKRTGMVFMNRGNDDV